MERGEVAYAYRQFGGKISVSVEILDEEFSGEGLDGEEVTWTGSYAQARVHINGVYWDSLTEALEDDAASVECLRDVAAQALRAARRSALYQASLAPYRERETLKRACEPESAPHLRRAAKTWPSASARAL